MTFRTNITNLNYKLNPLTGKNGIIGLAFLFKSYSYKINRLKCRYVVCTQHTSCLKKIQESAYDTFFIS